MSILSVVASQLTAPVGAVHFKIAPTAMMMILPVGTITVHITTRQANRKYRTLTQKGKSQRRDPDENGTTKQKLSIKHVSLDPVTST